MAAEGAEDVDPADFSVTVGGEEIPVGTIRWDVEANSLVVAFD